MRDAIDQTAAAQPPVTAAEDDGFAEASAGFLAHRPLDARRAAPPADAATAKAADGAIADGSTPPRQAAFAGAAQRTLTPSAADPARFDTAALGLAFVRELRGELADADPQRTLSRLKRALRRERARGRAGHWTYDLARHMRLVQDVRRIEATIRAAAFAPRPRAVATPA